MTRQERIQVPATKALVALAAFLVLGAPASAATWTVRVGRGGSRFVDDASGTNVTTITAGDTVTWVWEGTMQHSVTSGTCTAGGGGGYGGGYGGGCTDSLLWQSTGLHGEGFTFSQTFATPRAVAYYCAMHQDAMTGRIIVQPASLPAVCTPDEHTLCLNSGRFSVTAQWQKPDLSEGEGNAVPLTGDSGYFWFFDSSNIEAVTKVLNGCGIDNAYWVFAAGLTNVAVHVTVTDTKTGAVYTRDNAQGAAFEPIQDTGAFPASCP
jgi:plastocyanin